MTLCIEYEYDMDGVDCVLEVDYEDQRYKMPKRGPICSLDPPEHPADYIDIKDYRLFATGSEIKGRVAIPMNTLSADEKHEIEDFIWDRLPYEERERTNI